MTDVRVPDAMTRFKCNQQGCCCQGWGIPLQPPDLRRLIAHFNDKAIQEVLRGASFRAGPEGRLQRFELRKEGENKACHFLAGDNRCGLQVEHGVEVLPSLCRTYPAFAVEGDAGRELLYDLTCPEVLNQLAEEDGPYLIVEREASDGSDLEVRSRLGVGPPAIRVGEQELDFAAFRGVREAIVDALNRRERSVLHTLAAIHYALSRLAKGEPATAFAIRYAAPTAPFVAFFDKCVQMHGAGALRANFVEYRRFVFEFALKDSDWDGFERCLAQVGHWRDRFDPQDPELAPLLFRYLAHRFFGPFNFGLQSPELRFVYGTITHGLATAMRYATALVDWLGLQDRRSALKVAIGASTYASRAFRHLPTSSLPWFESDDLSE